MIKYLFVMIFIGLSGINYSFADGDYDGKSDHELLRNYVKERIGVNPVSAKYIYNIAYVGMTEKEFLNFFTWSKEFEGTLRPYIVKHIKDTYYLNEPVYNFMRKELHWSNISNTDTSRIKIKNGRLVKYEVQYWDKPPFVFLVYSDNTNLLRGYVDDRGFYNAMSESDFLREFSGSLLSHKGDKYVFICKNGKKYRAIFYNGYLIGQEPL